MSHVVRCVLERDEFARAVVLDAAPPDASAEVFFESLAERIEFIPGDVGDAATWERLHHENITHVVHGAAVTSIAARLSSLADEAARIEHVRRSLQANLMGAAHVLGFALLQPSLQRFINVSSGSVYGLEAPPEPLPEDGYVKPEGFYATSKYGAERITADYAAQFGIPAVSVRLSGVYGPMDRQTPGRDVRCVPWRIAHGARAGEALRVNSLEAIGDFIHAGDVGSAIDALLQAATLNWPVYNVAYGAPASVGELLEITRERIPSLQFKLVTDEQADVYLDPALYRGRFGPYDIQRLTADTGWRPRPLREAMHDYLQWLQDHPY